MSCRRCGARARPASLCSRQPSCAAVKLRAPRPHRARPSLLGASPSLTTPPRTGPEARDALRWQAARAALRAPAGAKHVGMRGVGGHRDAPRHRGAHRRRLAAPPRRGGRRARCRRPIHGLGSAPPGRTQHTQAGPTPVAQRRRLEEAGRLPADFPGCGPHNSSRRACGLWSLRSPSAEVLVLAHKDAPAAQLAFYSQRRDALNRPPRRAGRRAALRGARQPAGAAAPPRRRAPPLRRRGRRVLPSRREAKRPRGLARPACANKSAPPSWRPATGPALRPGDPSCPAPGVWAQHGARTRPAVSRARARRRPWRWRWRAQPVWR